MVYMLNIMPFGLFVKTCWGFHLLISRNTNIDQQQTIQMKTAWARQGYFLGWVWLNPHSNLSPI